MRLVKAEEHKYFDSNNIVKKTNFIVIIIFNISFSVFVLTDLNLKRLL